jgi:archaeal flagellin FlaB
MKKKADMGIGTLIIFIAMIIVAATVAAVFYQTASSLQQKALSTAEQSKRSISTRLNFVHISSENNNNHINHFFADVRLNPGSDGINLENSILTLSLSNISITYSYSNKSCINVSSFVDDGFFTDAVNNNGTFTIEYVMKSDSHRHGIIQRNEFAKLCFSSPYPISNDKNVEIKFVPNNGNPTTIKFITPDVITTKILQLYP